MKMFLHRGWFGLLVVAALAVLGAASAAAAEKDPRWYVGGTSDIPHVEIARGVGWQIGPDATGESVRGGLRLNDHFAVDLGLVRASNLEWREYFPLVVHGPGDFDRAVFDATTVQVSAKGILPFADIFEIYAKGGLAYSRLSGKRELTDVATGESLTRPLSASGTDCVIAIGAGVTVAPRWHVSVEVQSYAIDERVFGVVNGGDALVTTLALGVEYRFGPQSR